ncbi:hypothetical protein M747DRAFT_363487 [Aspergillus niger ATCC 13496]|uniref:Uncharacterized protein n=3 Tax=Aspergillus niger TaxID=5061 RepID=A2QJC2_ASPNC|nr:hypothetical protein An04g06540 [Aspergillus niger]RDH14353.1 hypothetical protein M747DRAFT_363487 [Aspergillus niger ATCC 13496]CAK44657.1 hypothetical protein An04g06540 [Aspergillus niger]
MLDIHCQSPREVNPDDNQGLYSGGDSDEMMLITSTNVLITWNNFYKQRVVVYIPAGACYDTAAA